MCIPKRFGGEILNHWIVPFNCTYLMTDPTAYGHFQQETGESRQVKGRPEGDCRPLKTDFVDTVWI